MIPSYLYQTNLGINLSIGLVYSIFFYNNRVSITQYMWSSTSKQVRKYTRVVKLLATTIKLVVMQVFDILELAEITAIITFDCYKTLFLFYSMRLQ